MANFKLKPEVKAKWLAALRSGKYRQVKENLRTENGFCCLGVLCDVAIQNGVEGNWNEAHGNCFNYAWKRSDGDVAFEGGTLPPPVLQWASLDEDVDTFYDNPSVMIVSEVSHQAYQYNLTALNDDEGYTFEQIADLIEKQL